MLKRRITFLAKAEYFAAPGLRGGWLTALVLRGAGQISVDRSGRAAGQAALSEGGQAVLAKGNLLAIYPEGTRSPDGRLYKGKVGVAVMALAARVLVIPCAVVGTYQIWDRARVLPRHPPVTIRFGEPLDFSRCARTAREETVLRAVTDEIMSAVLRLSGQEYVDRYAADVKTAQAPGGVGGVEVSAAVGLPLSRASKTSCPPVAKAGGRRIRRLMRCRRCSVCGAERREPALGQSAPGPGSCLFTRNSSTGAMGRRCQVRTMHPQPLQLAEER